MTDPAELAEADRWDREAAEELLAAGVIAEHPEIPNRVAGFHAHLAVEKALKALLIRRGIVVPRIHDLIELRALLPPADAARVVSDDLELLNPWTIEGRYPADLPDDDPGGVGAIVAAARRVLDAARAGDPPGPV